MEAKNVRNAVDLGFTKDAHGEDASLPSSVAIWRTTSVGNARLMAGSVAAHRR